MPHHVAQRGNRRQTTFLGDDEYAAYLELLARECRQEGVAIWGYCLMPYHIHLVAVPPTGPGAVPAGRGDRLVRVAPMLALASDWRAFLTSALDEQPLRHLRDHASTGRPPGDATFTECLKTLLGRVVRPGKPGRKRRFPKQPN